MDNEDIFHTEGETTSTENHMEIEGVFRCTPCEQIFKVEGNFREHMRIKHVNEDKEEYSCENCPFKTDCSQLLSNHMAVKHIPGKEEMKCALCQKQFTVKIIYDTHLQIGHMQTDVDDPEEEEEATEEASIKCRGTPGQKCNEKFKTMDDLMKHRKMVHPSTQVCKNFPGCKWGNECIHVHPGEMDLDIPSQVEGPMIACRLCSSKFTNKHNLMMHRKSEHIDRVNKCRDFESSTCTRTLCWYKHGAAQKVHPQQQQGAASAAPPPPPAQDFHQAWPNLKPPESVTRETNQMMHQMMQMQAQMQKQITHHTS